MTASRTLGSLYHFLAAHWRWATLRGAVLERYQSERARRIVRFAHQRSPFYRAHWAGHDVNQWQSLPTIDKASMMANFDTFNTRGVNGAAALELALRGERERNFADTLDGLTVGLSSGTSGHRGLFIVAPQEQTSWAGVILARAMHQLRRGLRVALFLRANSHLYESIQSALIRFRYFDLMMPLAEATLALNDYRPHILVGPPSLLGFLAEAFVHGQLRARPERLISVAEVLEPQDAARLTAVFQAPVHQIYQCTEGLLAVSCPAGFLHVQEDLVALQYEPVGESNRVTPIVTDLWRTTQPIIRYRLNDVLQLSPQPCACGSGFRVIQTIEGRQDDVCYFESQSGGLRPFFPDTLRRAILLAHDAIEDYQAIQERPGHLRVYLVTASHNSFDEVAQAVRESLSVTVAQYACTLSEVKIERGLIPVKPGAKRRRVQRLNQS